MALQKLEMDVPVGEVIDDPLLARVSVRGGKTVVLEFERRITGQRIEVTFTAKSARMLTEILEAGARLAEGRPV